MPRRLVAELGGGTALLTRKIQQFTVRSDFIDAKRKPLFSTFEEPVPFAARILNEAKVIPNFKLEHDRKLYRELGFTDRDYDDLVVFAEGLCKRRREPSHRDYLRVPPPTDPHASVDDPLCADLEGAFDHFADHIVRELMQGRSSLTAGEVVPGLAGIVGIAIDVTFFATSASVPSLLGSVTTGIAAIASKFSQVRRKLLREV
jgi:hypothetical protein